jgi:hypothetical protein
MLDKLRSHFSQNVVGYIALFVALGGTGAYASHEVIFTSDVADGTLREEDFFPSDSPPAAWVYWPHSQGGTPAPSQNKYVLAVRRPVRNGRVVRGTFCIDARTTFPFNPPRPARSVSATLAIANTSQTDNIIRAQVNPSRADCPFDSIDAVVKIRDISEGRGEDNAFYVQLFR